MLLCKYIKIKLLKYADYYIFLKKGGIITPKIILTIKGKLFMNWRRIFEKIGNKPANVRYNCNLLLEQLSLNLL